MFVMLVVLVLFPIMYVSEFSWVWILESPPIWERVADSVYHLSHFFADVTSCSFLCYIVGGIWVLIVLVPDHCPLQF